MNKHKNAVLEYNSTRFYISQKMYEELKMYPHLDFYLTVNPIKGNHTKGHYLIPNKAAKAFIESKQRTHNWGRHQNFNQDSIPSDLVRYFIASK